VFIRPQNVFTSPETASAIAIAASFPERSIRQYSKSFMVILSPFFNFTVEPPIEAAFELILVV
jgi:hypothetical protein